MILNRLKYNKIATTEQFKQITTKMPRRRKMKEKRWIAETIF